MLSDGKEYDVRIILIECIAIIILIMIGDQGSQKITVHMKIVKFCAAVHMANVDIQTDLFIELLKMLLCSHFRYLIKHVKYWSFKKCKRSVTEISPRLYILVKHLFLIISISDYCLFNWSLPILKYTMKYIDKCRYSFLNYIHL
jgi:hypothetical protein